MKADYLKKYLKQNNTILIDGAMGTEILRRGVLTTLPLWSAEALLTNPDVIREIHEDYIKSGAEIIITDTFRTTKRAFVKKGLTKKAKSITILACKLAQQAVKNSKVDHKVFIAGSIAPLEDCYSPELTPSEKELKKEHLEYAKNLKEGGVDFLLIETMITLRETLAAIKASEKAGLSFAVSFCINDQLKLLGGESLKTVVREVEKHNPLFIGINCISPEIATKGVKYLKTITQYPVSVYAQGDGIPSDDQGWKFTKEKGMNRYLKYVKKWKQYGAQIIGGCCGTNPAYIKSLEKFFSK